MRSADATGVRTDVLCGIRGHYEHDARRFLHTGRSAHHTRSTNIWVSNLSYRLIWAGRANEDNCHSNTTITYRLRRYTMLFAISYSVVQADKLSLHI